MRGPLRAALLLLLTLAGAYAQCPATNCKADFEVKGGLIDCCKWDYSKGPCWWGSTPVSWKRVRICNEEGKNYEVLKQSNFQGPPGGSPECRCSSPQVAPPTFSALQACIQLKPRLNSDVVGNDVPCKQNSFCQICGGLEAVKEACLANNRCVAFTFESSTGCGYLKSEPFTSTRSGWVTYTRD